MGGAALGRFERWQAAVRSCADVHNARPAGESEAVGRSDRIPDPGPTVVLRFLGLGLADADTIWTLREALMRAQIAGRPAIEVFFAWFEAALARAGFLAMSGQTI